MQEGGHGWEVTVEIQCGCYCRLARDGSTHKTLAKGPPWPFTEADHGGDPKAMTGPLLGRRQ